MTEHDATELVGAGDRQHAVVLVADILASDLSEDQLTERAARMQQMVGEAVYLFDGRVTDPFGPLLIAEMPDAAKAIEAARKARTDLAEHNRSRGKSGVVNARIVVHAGEVKAKGEALAGRTVEIALSVLDAMPAKQVAVSARAIAEAGLTPRSAPVTALGDVQFYDLPPEIVAEPVDYVDDATVVADREVTPQKSGSPILVVGISIIVILILAVVGWRFATQKPPEPEPAPVVEADKPRKIAAPTIASVRLVVEPFKIGTASPELAQQIASIRRVTIALLDSITAIDVVEGGDAPLRVGAEVRELETGKLLVPFLVSRQGTQAGQGVDPQYVGAAARGIAWWVAQRVSFTTRPIGSSNDEAMDHFAQAVMFSIIHGSQPNSDVEAEMKAALDTDPRFVAVYLFAEKYWASAGDSLRALEMIRAAHNLAPNDTGILSRLGRAELSIGNVTAGLEAFGNVLTKNPTDLEALRVFGRHALSVGDERIFRRVLNHLAGGDPATRDLHAPDIIAVAGDVNRAIGQYYQLETQYPTNLSLAFKIGRIAVLRRSTEIANIELAKLRAGDTGFRYHMMRAYLAANAGNAADAESALKLANGLAERQDGYHTCAAEIYAILGKTDKIVPELRLAVQSGEPTLESIRTSALFKFLESDAAYSEVAARIDMRKAEIQSKLLTAPIGS